MTTRISIIPTELQAALKRQLDGANTNVGGHSAQSFKFLRLPHPRTGVPSLFLPYEACLEPSTSSFAKDNATAFRHSILEVQSVSPFNARSWFIGHDEVVGDGSMLVLTPVDPAFLLLPVLQAVYPTQTDGTLGNFRPLEDIFEDAANKIGRSSAESGGKDASIMIPEQDVMHLLQLDCVRAAAHAICETKELTPDIIVYRYSSDKVLSHLRPKVDRLKQPEVMDRSRTIVRTLAKEGLMDDGKEDLLENGRVRAACYFISQYLPQDIHTALLASYDFTALDAFLAKQREADAAAALAAADASVASKKGTKKGKATSAEQEADGKGQKRKTAASQGVEKLKKVNTDGMKKISSFFGGQG